MSDASLWVRQSHLADQRILVDQDTLDQLVIARDREKSIFGIVIIAKILEVEAVPHLLFIEGPQVHQDIVVVFVHELDVDFPSAELIFPEFLAGLAQLVMPGMEKLILLESVRALAQGQLDQLLVEIVELRKDGLGVVLGILNFILEDLELLPC